MPSQAGGRLGEAPDPRAPPRSAMAGAPGPLLLLLLVVVRAVAAAERDLRFKAGPAETPVRLFTEPELARYSGQQVRPGPAAPAAAHTRRPPALGEAAGTSAGAGR